MIRAVIVEDSRLARLELRSLLAAYSEVEIVGEADTAVTALALIRQMQPDLLLLDIHLPGRNGLELLQELDDVPAVLFTTAFEQYALQAFDYNAIDYLLKPISPERFGAALQKVFRHSTQSTERPHHTRKDASRIFVKDGSRCWFVTLADISLLEAKGNYTRIHFNGNGPLVLKSLQQLEDVLDPAVFVRVNRQQIINVHFVTGADEGLGGTLKLTLRSGQAIEVSRRRARRLKEWFSL